MKNTLKKLYLIELRLEKLIGHRRDYYSRRHETVGFRRVSWEEWKSKMNNKGVTPVAANKLPLYYVYRTHLLQDTLNHIQQAIIHIEEFIKT